MLDSGCLGSCLACQSRRGLIETWTLWMQARRIGVELQRRATNRRA